MNKKPEYILVKDDSDNGSKELSWVVEVEGERAGAAKIDLEGGEYIDAPNVYIEIDEKFRGQGIGTSVLKEMIKYAYCNLTSEILYSRHQTSDSVVEKLNKKLGFENDDKPYIDNDGVEWQNVSLVL